jgi:hypothetical protein
VDHQLVRLQFREDFRSFLEPIKNLRLGRCFAGQHILLRRRDDNGRPTR